MGAVTWNFMFCSLIDLTQLAFHCRLNFQATFTQARVYFVLIQICTSRLCVYTVFVDLVWIGSVILYKTGRLRKLIPNEPMKNHSLAYTDTKMDRRLEFQNGNPYIHKIITATTTDL